jgi:hypothetical protein
VDPRNKSRDDARGGQDWGGAVPDRERRRQREFLEAVRVATHPMSAIGPDALITGHSEAVKDVNVLARSHGSMLT